MKIPLHTCGGKATGLLETSCAPIQNLRRGKWLRLSSNCILSCWVNAQYKTCEFKEKASSLSLTFPHLFLTEAMRTLYCIMLLHQIYANKFIFYLPQCYTGLLCKYHFPQAPWFMTRFLPCIENSLGKTIFTGGAFKMREVLQGKDSVSCNLWKCRCQAIGPPD